MCSLQEGICFLHMESPVLKTVPGTENVLHKVLLNKFEKFKMNSVIDRGIPLLGIYLMDIYTRILLFQTKGPSIQKTLNNVLYTDTMGYYVAI